MDGKDSLVRITSWNVAGKDPMNGTMLDYLFDDTNRIQNLRPHIQIVGLQEAPQYLFSDPWTNSLSSTLKKRDYILFKRHKLSGILLYIFVLREIILRTRDFETESVKTGFGGLLGNKGGVSLRFTLNGNSFCATNSHLAAHQENLEQRIQDYKSILEGTKFLLDANTTSPITHDYAFWFGDLNFRFNFDIPKHEVLNIITEARISANDSDSKVKAISKLYKYDQLIGVKKNGTAFKDYDETLPTFMPTYKFQLDNKDAYDSENRVPAWTDRILYRTFKDSYNMKSVNLEPKLDQLFYEALPETELSDHKPVVSMFKVRTFDSEKYNPSQVPYEPIIFEPIIGWKSGEDGRLWYKISNELFYQRPKVLSSWDRLALYKANFGSLEEYLTIVFANNIARLSPRLGAQEITYSSSSPSSRANSPSLSRRGSTTSLNSNISIGTEAISLERREPGSSLQLDSTSPAVPSQQPIRSTAPVVVNAVPDDAVIGDGFKYFTATFPDEIMIPGQYVVLYLKTNAANEYNVYGFSAPFNVTAN